MICLATATFTHRRAPCHQWLNSSPHVGKQLKEVLGNNEKLDGVIDNALEGADNLSSSQVDALKKKLTDTLNGNQGALETFRQSASVFVEKAVLDGLPENGSLASSDIVKDHIQNVLDNIGDNRKQALIPRLLTE